MKNELGNIREMLGMMVEGFDRVQMRVPRDGLHPDDAKDVTRGRRQFTRGSMMLAMMLDEALTVLEVSDDEG